MNREKAILQGTFRRQKSTMKKHLNKILNCQIIHKPANASEKLRIMANASYMKEHHDSQTHMQMFHDFCGAILTAPDNTEHLAIAYGNRSAFLFHIERYEDCIKDIDRAVNMTQSDTLKVKLLCRKAECLKKSGSRENKEQKVLEEAEKYVQKLDEKDIRRYNKVIEKVRAMTINADSIPAEERIVKLVTKDATECVKISHSNEFERHLLAEKDYAPGDIIFVEKTYVAHLNRRMIFTNCDYCLKTAWSGVPCKDCSWAIFCSEECREKANKLYHDAECSLIPLLKLIVEDDLLDLMRLILRAIIIGLKEAGSVSELMNRLKAVDACTDKSSKGFYKNGEFKSNTIESMYSLCSDYPEPDSEFGSQATAVLMVLIAFTMQTELMKSFRLKKIDDLIKSNELMFLGSLMMKLTNIRRNNNDALFCNIETCEQGKSLEECGTTSCCTIGCFMAPLISLINHSCDPNAGRCFTDNKKIIVYAIHPIKKGEQIFMSYYCHFYDFPLLERKASLLGRNISKCFCQACKENWPPVLSLPKEELVELKLNMQTDLEKRLYDDCSKILDLFKNKDMIKNKFAYCKMEDLQKLSKATSEAFQNLQQPSYLISSLAQSFSEVFSCIYGLKPRNFGRCSNLRE